MLHQKRPGGGSIVLQLPFGLPPHDHQAQRGRHGQEKLPTKRDEAVSDLQSGPERRHQPTPLNELQVLQLTNMTKAYRRRRDFATFATNSALATPGRIFAKEAMYLSRTFSAPVARSPSCWICFSTGVSLVETHRSKFRWYFNRLERF
jgi:hypothetical protein